MIAIIGLGNPGARYAGTRHNLGFAVVDRLAETWQVSWKNDDHLQAEIAELPTQQAIFVKPQTFMNLSGQAVQKILQKYRLKPSDCWIVVDDIALLPGQVRIRYGGGAGGHNGLKSLIECIGEQFYRFRLGVGQPQGVPLEAWVLQKPSAEDQRTINQALEQCCQEIAKALVQGTPTVTSLKG